MNLQDTNIQEDNQKSIQNEIKIQKEKEELKKKEECMNI